MAERLRQLHPNRLSGGALTLIFLALWRYSYVAKWAFIRTNDGLTVGFFPRLVTGACTLLALLVTFLPPTTYPAVLKTITPRRLLAAALGLTGIIAYATLMLRVGFLVVTPVFLGIFIAWLGVRPYYKAALFSLLGTGLMLLLFKVVGFNLPGFGG